MTELQSIIKQLDKLKAELQSGEVKPFPYSTKHTELLKTGLELLAKEQGVELKKVINQTVSELTVICKTGAFGEKFANTLNQYHFRTGIKPSKGHVLACHTWGYMGVSDVESMIRTHAL